MFIVSGSVVISNDGATILKTLDIVHPAAKTLVDIAKSQDSEVPIIGDIFFLFHHLLISCFSGVHYTVYC